jgi:Rieske Fe-S protein
VATCDTCGNEYDKTFTITRGEESGTFDSFECAVHAMAPTCSHCGCRILGHGVEVNGTMFCCAHCARHQDSGTRVADRA